MRPFLLFTFSTLLAIPNLSGCGSDGNGSQPKETDSPSSHDYRQRDATLVYWNSYNQFCNGIVAQLDCINQPREEISESNFDSQLNNLAQQLESGAKTIQKAIGDIGRIPVLDVDQRLIDDVHKDLRLLADISAHLDGSASEMHDFIAWKNRTQGIPNSAFSDFIKGLSLGIQGRPWAVLDEIVRRENAIDSEGKEILGRLQGHMEQLNEPATVLELRNIELRAFLSKKYQIEFQ